MATTVEAVTVVVAMVVSTGLQAYCKSSLCSERSQDRTTQGIGHTHQDASQSNSARHCSTALSCTHPSAMGIALVLLRSVSS